jgi:hypothetical protein
LETLIEKKIKISGEKLSDDEVTELFTDCMDPEDEDGNVFYARECLNRKKKSLPHFVIKHLKKKKSSSNFT